MAAIVFTYSRVVNTGTDVYGFVWTASATVAGEALSARGSTKISAKNNLIKLIELSRQDNTTSEVVDV